MPNTDLWNLWRIAHDETEISAGQFRDELAELTGRSITQPTLTRWNERIVKRERIGVAPSGRGQTSIYRRSELVRAALALEPDGIAAQVMIEALSGPPVDAPSALYTLWSRRTVWPDQLRGARSSLVRAFIRRAVTIERLESLLGDAPEWAEAESLPVVSPLLALHNRLRTEPVATEDIEIALGEELNRLVAEWANTPAPSNVLAASAV